MVRKIVGALIGAAWMVGCRGVPTPAQRPPAEPAEAPPAQAGAAPPPAPTARPATPRVPTSSIAPEAVAAYERAAAIGAGDERRALLERALEQFEAALGERARLTFSGDFQPGVQALGQGAHGEIVAVGRGAIVRIAPSDLWQTPTFDLPAPTTFLARRAALSRDATLGAYADRSDALAHVTVFDTRTGDQELAFSRPHGYVTALAFSDDGSRLASVAGGRATLWDLATGAPALEFEAKGYGIAFSHDGRSLATGEDVTVRIRNAAPGAAVRELGPHTSGVEALAFSPDDALLYAGDNAGWLRVWDVRSGKLLRTLQAHTDIVRGVVPLADNARFATASRDGGVALWHRAENAAVRTFPRQPAAITSFALADHEREFVTVDATGSLRISDVASGRVVRRIGYHVAPATTLAFPSNDELVVATEAGVRSLVLTSGTWSKASGLPERTSVLGRGATGELLSITRDFEFHRYARKADGYTRSASISLPSGSGKYFGGPARHPRSVEQAGGVVAALAGYEAFVWTSGGEVLALRRSGYGAFDLALAANGGALAVAFPNHVELVSVPSGTELARVPEAGASHPAPFTALALSRDARELVVADAASALIVVDRQGKQTLRRSLRAYASRLVASKNAPNRYFAALVDGSLALVEPHSSRARYFPGPTRIRTSAHTEESAFTPTALAVSPDERFIAIGYRGSARTGSALESIATLRLWSFDGHRVELVAALTEIDGGEGALISLDTASFDTALLDSEAASRLLRCTVGIFSLPLEACRARHSVPGLLAKRLEGFRKR